MPLTIHQIKNIFEAALFASEQPLSIKQLQELLDEQERPSTDDIKKILQDIAYDYQGRGIELREVASGFRFQVRQELSLWIAKLWAEKSPRPSRALLETLAIIAYRQPVTRGDIEGIRGVSISTNILKTLLDHDWIHTVGHKEVPGKPALYATTKTFLNDFNLTSLVDLPDLQDIQDVEQLELNWEEKEAQMVEQIEA